MWSLVAIGAFVAGAAFAPPSLWGGLLLAIPLTIVSTGFGWRHGGLLLPVMLSVVIAVDALTASLHGAAWYLAVLAAGALAVASGHRLFVQWSRAEAWSKANERRANLLTQAAAKLHLTEDPESLYRELTAMLSGILELSHTAVLVPREGELELVATHLWDIEPGYRVPLQSMCGLAYRTREEVYVPDTRVEPHYVAAPNMPLTCSELAVPLVVADEVVAVLNVEHREPGMFDDGERSTLRALTRIAEEALERIRSVDLLEQRSSEQAFLARFNQRLLSAASIRDVADIVLTELLEGLDIDSGVVFTVQDARFRAVAEVGAAPPRARAHIRSEGFPWGAGLMYETWLTQEPKFVSDYQSDTNGTPEARAMGLRAVAFVPISNAQGRTQALLAFGSFERIRVWRERDHKLLDMVASTLGVAFERAVLEEQMVKLLDIVRALAQTDDPAKLYAEAVESAVRLVPGGEAGSILVRKDGSFTFAATYGFDEEALKTAPPFSEEEQLRWYGGSRASFRRGVARLVTGSDIARQSARARRDRMNDPIEEVGRVPELKANICVPITFHGEVIGILNVDNLTHEAAFGASDLRLAEAFGQQVGVIIRQAEYREALERSVVTDRLTGLGNREGFNRQLAAELSRARRYGQPLNLVIMDLDGFKAINDAFGHQVGDETLILVADAIRKEKREGDTAYRWGGDEFALLIPHVGSEDARRAAERYADSIERILVEGRSLAVSIGVANFPEDADGPERLLRVADDQMYMRKGRRGEVGALETPRAAP